MSMIYVPVDENGFADRANISIYEPESDWCPYDRVMDQFYKPRFDNESGQWVEGATLEEIEAMKPQPVPPQPTPQERIEALENENALLAIELAQTQIRLDQAEQEQAALLFELVSRGVI